MVKHQKIELTKQEIRLAISEFLIKNNYLVSDDFDVDCLGMVCTWDELNVHLNPFELPKIVLRAPKYAVEPRTEITGKGIE